jgi:hypothetical protein
MPRFTTLLAVWAFLPVAGHACAQEPAAPLSFGWEIPSRGTVTQVTLKKGRELKSRYRIELGQAEDGELLLSASAFELLEANGMDLTTPQYKDMAAQQAVQLRTGYPELRLAASGELLRVEDWEAHVDRCVEQIKSLSPGGEAPGLANMRAMMLDPGVRPMLEAKAGEHWQVWVGAWLATELAPGERLEGVTELPIGQELIEAKLTLEHQGETDGGHIRLVMTTLIEGEEAKAAFRKVMLDLTRRGPNPLPEDFDLEAFSKEGLVTVTTDPRTLRPVAAMSQSKDRLVMGGEVREQVERRSYTFEWE